jgi:hypothetical protein
MVLRGTCATAMCLALFGLSSCARQQEAQAQQRPPGASYCDDARAHEAFLAAAASDDMPRLPLGLAFRDGDQLHLKLDGGNFSTLQDERRGCGDGTPDCRQYRLLRWFAPQHAYLVRMSGYEAGAFLLIDARTGVKLSLPGMPLWSPGGEWIATDVLLEVDQPPAISVYSWPAGKQVFYRRNEGANWQCLDHWDGPEKLAFTVDPPHDAATHTHAVAMYAVRTARGWQLGRPD